ncbi:ShlB/FhaC/HecB family hemolysin secretion/activation protein [Burkholderia diffusa]|uniref:ShlB/FhaC/HecB family hemolysin secretion/activation protein n=1 Tax=Burkholderia diffusa TaxID=488732 RepID=UPI0018C87E40|nr:ShlB/FhaC/HecB family hemolysin secretion/activation protein [Burkholderia diffusa]
MIPVSTVWANDVASIPVQSISYEGILPADAAKVFDAVASQASGQSMDKAQTQAFVQHMTAALREAGYPVATVLLTDSEWSAFAASGALRLRVFEGDVGRAVVNRNTSAVNTVRIERTVQRALCGSKGVPCVLTSRGLERAELLLQDLPGVKLESVTLSPEGVAVGQTAVEVAVEASRPRFSGTLSVDNYGVTSSGMNRAGAGVEADNLLHMGDIWQLSGMTTNKHQNTGVFDFSIPIAYSGLRAEVNVARTVYELPQVNASGEANSATAGLSYPITRGLNGNWITSLNAFDVLAEQTVNGISASAPTHLAGVRLSLAGNAGDRSLDLGLNYWSANAMLTFGREHRNLVGVDTAGTIGQYAKLAISGFDKQMLSKNWYALLNVRAQTASRNLNSYESMGMGGVGGVRAYSSNEGSLNQGVFLSGEIRRLIRFSNGAQLAPGLFVDYITGSVLHSTYHNWQTSQGYADSNLSNHRWLAGWGVGVDWVSPKQLMTTSLTLGWRMPGSPESTYKPGSANGRVLVSVGMKF